MSAISRFLGTTMLLLGITAISACGGGSGGISDIEHASTLPPPVQVSPSMEVMVDDNDGCIVFNDETLCAN